MSLVEFASSAVTVLAAVWAIARWSGRVDANTVATERLTQTFDAFGEKIADRLSDHEVRISLLERRDG